MGPASGKFHIAISLRFGERFQKPEAGEVPISLHPRFCPGMVDEHSPHRRRCDGEKMTAGLPSHPGQGSRVASRGLAKEIGDVAGGRFHWSAGS